jgi:aminopeptidase-like protein
MADVTSSAEIAGETGRAMVALVTELYPICRSITGDGVRATLDIVSRHAPLETREVPSGTPVLDWTIPKEWNVRDAWIENAAGERVVDFRASNLHVVSYSVPIRARMPLRELRAHLHTLPDRPDLVPYRTSYYDETWGFCLSQRVLDSLPDGDYDVCIDSTLAPGALTYGEFVVPGLSDEEILISTHVCHPSLCDDNLTGIAVSVFLARELAAIPGRRYTMRFVYAPGTIGAIAWLAKNPDAAHRIRHGLTLTCLGDTHPFTYKRTVGGCAEIDRAAAHVLAKSGLPHQTIDFFPYGYDERQYNSPGFRVPVGSLMRGRHGQFPEYHTSADNLNFISAQSMTESLRLCRGIVDVLQGNAAYSNLAPFGEPQLGRRGLYRALGGTNIPDLQLAMLWVLNLSDGHHTLLDVTERSQIEFRAIRAAADLLLEHGLLGPAPARPVVPQK